MLSFKIPFYATNPVIFKKEWVGYQFPLHFSESCSVEVSLNRRWVSEYPFLYWSESSKTGVEAPMKI